MSHNSTLKYIDQILPSYSEYDAIGSHVTNIQKILLDRGFGSRVFYEIYREPTAKRSISYNSYLDVTGPGQILIYHHSIGSCISDFLFSAKAYPIMLYHNITPPEYFKRIGDFESYEACCAGIRQLQALKLVVKNSWTVSRYNADELEAQGFRNIEVFPLLRNYSNLKNLIQDGILKNKLSDQKENFLFVGRILLHKAQHELLMFLKNYQEFVNPNVRLILVGGASPYYLKRFKFLTDELKLSLWHPESDIKMNSADVLWFEQVSDTELATIYRASKLFLCLSEHEGFCVPLIEAMSFGLPVIANAAAAIPETCGNSAILIDKWKNPEALVMAVKGILNDEVEYRKRRELSLLRAQDFSEEVLNAQVNSAIDRLILAFNTQ